jgi:hypothetical protein
MRSPLTKARALLLPFAILRRGKRYRPRRALAALLVAMTVPLLASGCFTHAVQVEPITLAPIQMTVDVNVHSDRAEVTDTVGAEAPPDPVPVTP